MVTSARHESRADGGRSVPRPRRAAGPVTGSIVVFGLWLAVAHNSGSGWVQALGALLAGFLVIGLFAPAVAVWRARCEVTSSPADGNAGQAVTLSVAPNRPLVLRPLSPPGDAVPTGRRAVVDLATLPSRRGVVTECRLEVASAAPFGLLWWTKVVVLALPRPLLVAPRLGPADPTSVGDDTAPGDDHRRVDQRVGEPKGVRAYQPGDERRWVHWPATAHTGSLMVREMEGPAARPTLLDVVLPEDPDEADAAAERAMGTVAQLLRRGVTVQMVTREPGGVRSEAVTDLTEAGRRLARAVAGVTGRTASGQ